MGEAVIFSTIAVALREGGPPPWNVKTRLYGTFPAKYDLTKHLRVNLVGPKEKGTGLVGINNRRSKKVPSLL
jgi:hypothetical protein